MGQMKRTLGDMKMPSIEEAVVIEMVTSLPALRSMDYNFHSEASQRDMTSREFTTYVERTIGAYFDDRLREQIDWEYVAKNWWDEREVPEFPEDSPAYRLTL